MRSFARGTRQQLSVEADKVNLPGGTVLTVVINSTTIGTMTLQNHRGEVESTPTMAQQFPPYRKATQ